MPEEKFNWVIANPGWSDTSNGILMLFRLCHYLNEFGENAFMLANEGIPDEKPGHGLNVGKSITRKEYEALDPAKTVAVYPEMVYGNPLDAKIVVRWILNTPGVAGGDGKFDAGDFIFIYSDYFKSAGSAVDGKMTIYNPYFENFTDDGQPRQRTCYMIRKGWQKPLVHHPKDALLIDDYGEKGGNDYLRQCFNRFETFITYDHATLACVQAALCGCVSIVIPDGLASAQEWRLANPMAAYGVAYGFDDVDWANLTRPLLREHLRILEKSSVAEIKNFIRVVKRGKKPASAGTAQNQAVSKMGSTDEVRATIEADGDPLWRQFTTAKQTFEFGYHARTGFFSSHDLKLYYPTGRLVKIRLAISGGKIKGPLSFTLASRPGLINVKKLAVHDSNGNITADLLGENAKDLEAQGTAFLLPSGSHGKNRRTDPIIVSTGNHPLLKLPDLSGIHDKNFEILIEFVHTEDMHALKLEFEALAAAWKLIDSARKSKKLSWHAFLVLVITLQVRFLILLVRFNFYKKQRMRSFFKKAENSVRKRWKEFMEILRAKDKK
jgi:hypothetical protein